MLEQIFQIVNADETSSEATFSAEDTVSKLQIVSIKAVLA